jgi:hypothetical protein
MYRTMAELNGDWLLDDAKVLWTGRAVSLMTQGGKILTTLDAELPDLQGRIRLWCAKNNYRCTQIYNGKIWL